MSLFLATSFLFLLSTCWWLIYTNNSINNINTKNWKNDKNNNDYEENEDLDIISTQVGYHLGVNNIQVNNNNSIIQEDDDKDTHSIDDEVNYDDINNDNAATDNHGENDSDIKIYTYLTQATVHKAFNNSVTPTITTTNNND